MDLPDDTRPGLLANVASGDNSPALSVSELSGALKRTIETAFGEVRVRGEISGFKRHGSGHCYFTLKDENACIDAVIWRGNAATLAFRPEDGAEIIATGKLTTYPGRSKYQIVVERMELAGEGALLALLEKRRNALAAEGLFDAERKRKLPFVPRIVGVVSAVVLPSAGTVMAGAAGATESTVKVWASARTEVLPAVSVATAVIVCWPLASDPVDHQSVHVQLVVPPHVPVENSAPSP